MKPLEHTENRYTVQKDVEGDAKKIRDLKRYCFLRVSQCSHFKNLTSPPFLQQNNSILNKLTPEKFEVLVKRVMEIDINSLSLLKDIVNCVFEKALDEPVFSPVYAEFCLKLSDKLPTYKEEVTGEAQSFKRLILNQCQVCTNRYLGVKLVLGFF